MLIDSAALSDLMLQIAAELFELDTFKRRELMDATEREVRRRNQWIIEDDEASNSVGVKSRGLASIDYRFSDLSREGKLISERTNVWRLNPKEFDRIRNYSISNTVKPDHYIARLSFNTKGWRAPAGDAQAQEEDGTYNQQNRFGHEDWLFRNEWLVDGWRYSFIQGVNKSRNRLLQLGRSFNVTLFTIDDQQRRRFVATIYSVECLSDTQADAALALFKQRGWLDVMRQDIQDINGNATALGSDPRAKHVLNVRFRIENVAMFGPAVFAAPNEPVQKLNRYTLTDMQSLDRKIRHERFWGRSGSETPPNTVPYVRRASAPVVCSPEHAAIQSRLVGELKTEFPAAQILCEEDFVDVVVKTQTEILMFEIKSDQNPLTVLRQGIGQILEYAYHPSRRRSLPVRLFIVGREPLKNLDREYLDRLRTEFNLPIDYRAVTI